MNIAISKFAVVPVLLSVAFNATAGTSGGTIHFVGSIVEPPCNVGNFETGQININCERHTAFNVAFQRIGPDTTSDHSTATLMQNGKSLNGEKISINNIHLQGNVKLKLMADKTVADATLGPVMITISYE